MIAWDYPTLSGVDPKNAHVGWRTKAQETINARLARVMGTDSVNVSLAVIAGHPAEVLLDASVGAELLVVGKRRHNGFTEMLSGPLREHVITHATCPVLVMCHASDASAGASE